MRRLLPLLLCASALAQTAVERGEAAYRAGDFAAARQQFEAALATGAHDAGPLLFDLGNCCYRRGDHAEAAWYFRRAQLRLPDDPRVRFNLHLAQEQLGVAAGIDGPRGVLVVFDRVPPAALLTLIAALQGIGLLGWLWSRRRGVRAAMLLLAAGGFALGVQQTTRLWSEPDLQGVVLEPQLLLRQQPQTEAATGVTLQAGEVVQVRAATAQWLELEHARGRGWAARQRIGLID